ncbi:TetR/AcrR family transcriptional regulator [Streptantibioticus parmotrematis]|uniref:TetR/AcrR family transcriptional regulator n=1 Tax=Streptantibioticus parmotrematis TaxID=2873249 RepID=UPI0033F14073
MNVDANQDPPADSPPVGRRERKKARTRQALADAALRLFLDRGYDQVGVKEVADAADVSVTTLFKHFPCKEALVFDLDDDIEASLVAAVRDRPAGQSVPGALRDRLLTGPDWSQPEDDEGFAAFSRMVERTPALIDYRHRMWLRHEAVLARVIAEEEGAPLDDVVCAALARFTLESSFLARRQPDPQEAVRRVFALLERGWESARPGGGA